MLERNSDYYEQGNQSQPVTKEILMANALLEKQAAICGMVTRSPELRRVAAAAIRIAEIDSTVLILGESGVGKDMLAQLIYKIGNRRNKPLVKIACGAIPDNLLESELFGYEGGAFTGARREGKKGLFEQAADGTVFLDEVGDLPLLLQVKLLNVLQDHQFLRIGGLKPLTTQARVIAATNCNLEQQVKEGTFREDLYYRLNVIPLTIPPLRDRRSDIGLLINHFLHHYCQRYQLTRTLCPVALNYLLCYDWPGNVRELQNVLEFLVVMSPDQVIGETQVPDKIVQQYSKCRVAILPSQRKKGLKDSLEEYERALIISALDDHETLRDAAESLGIDISTLTRKKQKYQLYK